MTSNAQNSVREGAGLDQVPLAESVSSVYVTHYAQLVRIAAFLLREPAAAEDVVQDAYVRVAQAAGRGEIDKTLAYLRQAVVNGARSHLRRRMTVALHVPAPTADTPGAEEAAIAAFKREAVVRALQRLPRRQREVLVLRYYADLSEREIAETLEISSGSVKAYASRGLDALAIHLEDVR